MLPKWFTGAPCFKIPTGVLNRGFGHAMATHRPHQRKHLRCIFDSLPDNHGREKLLHGCPDTCSPLGTVKRFFAGGAFSPTFRTFRIGDSHDHNSPFSGAAKTSFEEVDE